MAQIYSSNEKEDILHSLESRGLSSERGIQQASDTGLLSKLARVSVSCKCLSCGLLWVLQLPALITFLSFGLGSQVTRHVSELSHKCI